MDKSIKDHVVSALRSLMEPIIMMLLRNGVTYKEFSLLCKNIFVEVAARDFGIRGRPTNISRISVLTGIDRKEVKRIKDLLQENTQVKQAQQTQDRLTRILSGWHQDNAFLDSNNQPKKLTMGEFTDLSKRYGGDVPVGAILKELKRGGCVEVLDDGTLNVLQRYFFPSHSDPESLLRAGTVIHDLASSLFHNLYGLDTAKNKRLKFERRASNNRINPIMEDAFYTFLDKEGQEFLERVDDWRSAHELPDNVEDESKMIRLGTGVYFIDKNL